MKLPSFRRTRSAMLLHQVLVKWAENQLVRDLNREYRKFWRKVQTAAAANDQGAMFGDASELKTRLQELIQEARVGLVAFTVVDLRRWIRKTNEKLANEALDLSSIPLEDQELIRQILQNEDIQGLGFDERLARYTADMQRDIVDILSKGIADGRSIPEMTRDLRTPLQISRYRAERLARTETMHVSNTAALKTYGSMGDVVSGIQYDATLDIRACSVCAAYDGQKFYYAPKAGEKGIEDAPKLPIHCNCRCFFSPLSRSWEELGADVTGEETSAERESFEQWLDRQPDDVQRQVMGSEYDAYRDGGIEKVRKALGARVSVTKLSGDWKAAWDSAKRSTGAESHHLPLLPGRELLCASRKTVSSSTTRASSSLRRSRRGRSRMSVS